MIVGLVTTRCFEQIRLDVCYHRQPVIIVGARLLRVGTPDEFFHEAGEQEHARERLGLTARRIAERVEAM